MKDTFQEFRLFLREHKAAWIVPIVIVAIAAGLIAWKLASTADNPFAYDLH